MLRFRLQELLADQQFAKNERVTLTALATATGINRVTLSKMVNQRGYSTVTGNLDLLCKFFGCTIEQLVEYVPDEDVPDSASTKVVAQTKAKSAKNRKSGR